MKKPMRKKEKDKKLLRNSVLKAFTVFIFGYGVLEIFWELSNKNITLLGFYDFYAATIGDGLFLPIFVGAGSYFSNINNVEKKYVKISIVAMIIAILEQASWLVSNETVLNWTIDRLHHFTYAGWYHAIYFVCMSVILTRVFCKAVYANRMKNVKGKVSYEVMWLAGFGYWNMHLIDDYLSNDNYLKWIIFSTITFVTIYLLFNIKCKLKKIDFLFFVGSVVFSIVLITYCSRGGLELNVQELIYRIKNYVDIL